MTQALSVCLLVIFTCSEMATQSQSVSDRNAVSLASYRNLTPGRSRKADVQAALGKPNNVIQTSAGTEYVYLDPDSATSRLEVTVDSRNGRVRSIAVYPHGDSVTHVIKRFGRTYKRVQYAFDECLSDGESAPLFRSPGGPVVYLEYQDRGVFVAIDGDQVVYIQFSAEPPGAPISQCQEKTQPLRHE